MSSVSSDLLYETTSGHTMCISGPCEVSSMCPSIIGNARPNRQSLCQPTCSTRMIGRRWELTKLGMHERLLIKCGERTFRSPVIQSLPVHTRVINGEVWPWSAILRPPVEGDNGGIGVAHERLADIVHAMVLFIVSNCSDPRPAA